MEIWKHLKDSYDRWGNLLYSYEISSYGRVKCNGEIKQFKVVPNGYIGCIMPYKTLHRAVAITFLKNPDNKLDVNHIDGDKTNNHVSNLEWATRSGNQLHAYANGLNHTPKKFDEDTSKIIADQYEYGVTTQKGLAKKYNVTQTCIRDILIKHNKIKTRLTSNQKQDIRRRFSKGETIENIASNVGWSYSTIYSIVNNKKYYKQND